MPTLNWIGKEKVISHHQEVPYRILEHKYGFTADPSSRAGEEQTEITESGNKIIHGDNLEALKSLLPEYEGKIKCIYIDPPYNTGNENWVYNDNVNHPKIKKWLGEVVGKENEDLSRHDKWLCMMYPRLQLLHKLLSDDGAIFMSIDDNEQANLKLMCDEIFGGRNFIANIVWQKKYGPANDAKYFSQTHEFIITYCKNKDLFKHNLIPRNKKQLKAFKNYDKDKRGLWRASDLSARTYSESGNYVIYGPHGEEYAPPPSRAWIVTEKRYKELLDDNRITFGKTGKGRPMQKKFLSEIKSGVTVQTWWDREFSGDNKVARYELKDIFPRNPFDTPKPTALINRILQIGTNKNSIILDSFAGSGTTAHAVLNLNKQDGGNRKFILVEMEDYADNITAERVKRVAKGYGGSASSPSKKEIEGTGGSFDFYELGLPLFDENHHLNETIALAKIQEYIWFSEMRTAFKNPDKENYYLGKKDGTVLYFIYEKKQLTTLDYDSLGYIKTKGEQYIIYADNCLLPKDFMAKHNIIFKKIPRDITRF